MTVTVPAEIREAMVAHAYGCHPEESCGLLAADSEGRLRMAYPLTNALHTHTNYTIEPREHFKALKHAESMGWDLVGVFHSHPHTVGYPSATDVQLAPDPDWLYVLVGMEDFAHPTVRGFRIRRSSVVEEDLEFLPVRESLIVTDRPFESLIRPREEPT